MIGFPVPQNQGFISSYYFSCNTHRKVICPGQRNTYPGLQTAFLFWHRFTPFIYGKFGHIHYSYYFPVMHPTCGTWNTNISNTTSDTKLLRNYCNPWGKLNDPFSFPTTDSVCARSPFAWPRVHPPAQFCSLEMGLDFYKTKDAVSHLISKGIFSPLHILFLALQIPVALTHSTAMPSWTSCHIILLSQIASGEHLQF